MSDSPTNKQSLLKAALEHLSNERPFRKELFASEDANDIRFFSHTDEVEKMLKHLRSKFMGRNIRGYPACGILFP